MKIIRQATLDRYRLNKDRSVSFTFITDLEQSDKEFGEFFHVNARSGFVYFKTDAEITDAELEQLDKTEILHEGKSRAQRLRSVLYVLYKETETDLGFDEFYQSKMEQIIEHFKAKLPEKL